MPKSEKDKSHLLIDESPLQVLPSLAKRIGLNNAIVVQQIHYWLRGKRGKKHRGRKWVYNTWEAWQEEFPFWSRNTIRGIFGKLVEMKIVLTSNLNKHANDHTLWFTLDYERMEATQIIRRAGDVSRFGLPKSGRQDLGCQSLADGLPKSGSALPKNTSKNTEDSFSGGFAPGTEGEGEQEARLPSSEESGNPQKPPTAVEPPLDSIDQPLKDAVAKYLYGITVRSLQDGEIGIVAQDIAGLWRAVLAEKRGVKKVILTAKEYRAIARSIGSDDPEDYTFLSYYRETCPGMAVPRWRKVKGHYRDFMQAEREKEDEPHE